MISLSATTGGVRFTFENSAYYLYGNGTIDVPVNSLLLVDDGSDSVTFKKIDGDVFISAPVSEFDMSKSDIEEFYENNMVGGGVDPEEVVDIVESATSYYDGVEYDSVNSRINFKHNNVVEGYIDAAPFIVDGMVDNVAIVNGNLVITFNTDSGKQPISIPLTDIFDPSNYYDKNAVDTIISGVNDSIIEDEEVISSALNDLNERKLDASAYTPTDLSNYYTKSETSGATEIQGALDDKADKATAGGGLSIGSLSSGRVRDIIKLSNQYGQEIIGAYKNLYPIRINNQPIMKQFDSAPNLSLVETSAITSSVTSASTDSQIPTAKAVYDALGQGGGGSYSAGRGIDITNDVISFNLPISAGTGTNSVKCGVNSNANGSYSFAIGSDGVKANGMASFAGGSYSEAKQAFSMAFGRYNIANNYGEVALGFYNKSNGSSSAAGNISGNTLFSVGNGTNNTDNTRHNAFEIRQNGDIYITKDGADVKLQDQLGGGGSASSAITSGDTNAVQGGAVYDKFDEVEQVTAAALNLLNTNMGGLKFVKLSQQEYDDLAVKDSSTMYVII